jgi:hypothetical protein
MKATELFEALKGVPEAAIAAHVGYDVDAGVWMYLPPSLAFDDLDGYELDPSTAAALQRDAMWLWLESNPDPTPISVRSGWEHGKLTCWCVYEDQVFHSSHATPTEAFAAACRFVAENTP